MSSLHTYLVEILPKIDTLERVFKASNLVALEMDGNVLNEYRYLLRAIADMGKCEGDPTKFADAKARANTAYSCALCDTVDNVHLFASRQMRRISDIYPMFPIKTATADFEGKMNALKYVGRKITESRFDRPNRIAIYEQLADSDEYELLTQFALDLPTLAAAATNHTLDGKWFERIVDAIENREFLLVIQPKRNIEDMRIVSGEVLLRWNLKGKFPLSPAVFIPEAEKCGAIHLVGKFVLEETCKILSAWQNDRIAVPLSVNVSPLQLIDPLFAEMVKARVKEFGLSEGLLELEITEEVLIDDTDGANSQFTILTTDEEGRADKHITIAVDDFGKGSTQFQYLAHFPIETIKIDKDIVDTLIKENGLEDDPQARFHSLIRGIASMGDAMKIKVVVEGVENEQTLKCLQTLGLKVFQGYYNNGEPTSPENFAARLRTQGLPKS